LTVVVPVLPSLVAVMVAVPAFLPFTVAVYVPAVCVSVTMLLSEVVHVTTRPGPIAALDASLSVACRTTLSFFEIEGFEGEIVTLPTGVLVTVTDAVPLLPSLVAVMVAVPLATPVTTPPATVATAGCSTSR